MLLKISYICQDRLGTNAYDRLGDRNDVSPLQATVKELAAVLLKQFGHSVASCPPPNKMGVSVLPD